MISELAKYKNIIIISHIDEIDTAKRIGNFITDKTGIEASTILSSFDENIENQLLISINSIGGVIFLYSPLAKKDKNYVKLLRFFKNHNIKVLYATNRKEDTDKLLSLKHHPNDIYKTYKESFFSYGFINYLVGVCEASFLNEGFRKRRGDTSISKEIFLKMEEYKSILKTILEKINKGEYKDIPSLMGLALNITTHICEIVKRYNSKTTIFTSINERTKAVMESINKNGFIESNISIYTFLLIEAIRLADLLEDS